MENPVTYAKHHKYIMGGMIIIVVLATAIGTRLGKRQTESQNEQVPKVSQILAQDYLRDRGQISANGTVESLQQAELRSQASAPVTKIYAQIGQKVSAGQILVTLQNNDIGAQLMQARAQLSAQQARLDEMKKGARSEELKLVETKVQAAKQALEDTQNLQDTTTAAAYTNLLNAGLAAIPDANNAAGSANPSVTGSYTGTDHGEYRISIYATGGGLRFQFNGLENGNGPVNTAPTALGTRGLFIQFSSGGVPLNNIWTISLPNTQAAAYNQLNAAYLAAEQSRDAAVNGARSAYDAAQREYELTLAGATNEQIRAAQAAVDQAAAAVAAASAQYDKTIIRSPISGIVAELPVKYGELVSPGALVASVVSQGGLQIKAYISDYDLPYAAEGAEVLINGSATGTLSRLSPSVNSQTKNVEIQVIVSNPVSSGLVVGQNAALKISARQPAGGSSPVFLLPLQSVNIANSGASVFTVKSDFTLEEHQVTLGSVSGETVEVKDGLTPDMKIVSPVYELKNSEKVSAE